MGQNPPAGGPNGKLHRQAMRRLDWLVVIDLFEKPRLPATGTLIGGGRSQDHPDRGLSRSRGVDRREEGSFTTPNA